MFGVDQEIEVVGELHEFFTFNACVTTRLETGYGAGVTLEATSLPARFIVLAWNDYVIGKSIHPSGATKASHSNHYSSYAGICRFHKLLVY